MIKIGDRHAVIHTATFVTRIVTKIIQSVLGQIKVNFINWKIRLSKQVFKLILSGTLDQSDEHLEEPIRVRVLGLVLGILH